MQLFGCCSSSSKNTELAPNYSGSSSTARVLHLSVSDEEALSTYKIACHAALAFVAAVHLLSLAPRWVLFHGSVGARLGHPVC